MPAHVDFGKKTLPWKYRQGQGGGPGLELTLPACYLEQGLTNLGPGTLSYQNETFNRLQNRWEKPSPELRKGYGAIARIIKSLSRRLQKYRNIWIGENAISLLDKGQAVITGFER